MKATLEFDLDNPDDVYKYQSSTLSEKMRLALFDVGNEIFRPARKHGYTDQKIRELIDACGVNSEGCSNGEELISALEGLFFKIMNSNGLSSLDR
jgi:hypothetical protein